MTALQGLITTAVGAAVATEIGQALAPLHASSSKSEARLIRIETLLERIVAMDNLQNQMKAGQASGLVAAPERKVGKKRAAAKAGGSKVKQISNAMLYFYAMWRQDPDFRAKYLGGERKMLPALAISLGVYGAESPTEMTPEAKAECEAKFAAAARTDAERKAECKQIWKHGLTSAHKNVLKTDRVAWNTAQLEAARADPLVADETATAPA